MNAALSSGVATWWGGDALTIALEGATGPLSAVTLTSPAGAGAASSGRLDGTYPVFQGLVTAFLPQLDQATRAASLTLTDATGAMASATFPVYAPLYGTYTFQLRGYLPSTWDTGPRSMSDVPAAGESTPSNFAILTASLAAGLNAFGGTYLTRLAADIQPGTTVFAVEHAAAVPSSGRAQVDGVPYTYGQSDIGPAAPSLSGITSGSAGQTRPGARAFHASLAQVAYAGAPVTDLVRVRDAVFLDTATGADLTALGRNLGVIHSPAVANDDQYRALVKAIAYGPKTSVFGVQLALDALLGAGNYTLREDPVGAPCQVIIGVGYTALTQAGSLGRSYMGEEVTVAPATDGSISLDAPVFGAAPVHPVSGGAPVRVRDLNLLEGNAATSVDPSPVVLAGTSVPAPIVTPQVAPATSDVGLKLDLLGGTQPGRYIIAAVRGGAYVVHQGIYDNVSLASAAGSALTMTVPMPDGAAPETNGWFVYPRDIGRTVAIGGKTGTITAVLDPTTLVSFATYRTPLVQRSNRVAVSGLGLPPQTGVQAAVLPAFTSQSQVPYRTAGAYAATTSGTTTTLRRRAPVSSSDAGTPLTVCASTVLSAQVVPSPGAETVLTGTPPTPNRYPLYIDAPFAVLQAYLDDLTAAGVKPSLEFY